MTLASPMIRPDELAILSLDAAIEIDRFRRNKTTSLTATRAFVDGLKEFRGQHTANSGSLDFYPDSTNMFDTAVAEAFWRHCKTVGELDKVMIELISEFEAASLGKDGSGSKLGPMMDFCLSIHRFVVLGA